MPEQVEDGVNGFLVPPGDVDALATAIKRLITGDAEDMARQSRARAEARYTWGRHLQSLDAVYTMHTE